MDFVEVEEVHSSGRTKTDIAVYPEFVYQKNKDIVLKGGSMQAFWYDGKWQDRLDVLVSVVDQMTMEKYKPLAQNNPDKRVSVKLMRKHSSKVMDEFIKFCKNNEQSDVDFNTKILFSEDEMKREDYATWKLSYTPKEQETPAFEEMYQLLYEPEELEKIMWFIGALLTNNMVNIQKFLYLYGGKGTGKGTVIKLLEMLFEEYKRDISVEELTSDNAFATSGVQQVPLLVDADADLMKIRKDTNLLKLTAHEPLSINNKYQQQYNLRFNGLLVVASNQRYVVRNVDSGITRRVVVAEPSGEIHSPEKYRELMAKIKYELPGIAQACIQVFTAKGINYYEEYTNVEMAEATDHIFQFVREHSEMLGDPCSLSKASKLYKIYLEDIGFETKGYKRKIKNELQRYYYDFKSRHRVGDTTLSNVFVGFKYKVAFPERYMVNELDNSGMGHPTMDPLSAFGLVDSESLFDKEYGDAPAQKASKSGNPIKKWDDVTTTLSDIDTEELHWVQLPRDHIIIDLDLKNESGEKDILLNLEESKRYPETYTEVSKSGNGLHLHYIWDGDVDKLENQVKEDVEIKKFVGRSSLRRQLTYCNDKPVVHISTGLPFKEDTKMRKEVETIMWNEKKLRTVIEKNLRKEYHAATKPSIDFIAHVLHKAKEQGVKYDLSDMRNDVLVFGLGSTNNSAYCRKAVVDMPFSTIEEELEIEVEENTSRVPDEDLVFYDVEVFSNLFVVAFKPKGRKGTIWINPTAEQIESLCEKPLVGFNNRRYDNHILYGAMLGLDNMGLYRLSQGIIDNNSDASYSGAYELSYADIYEYNSTKQSLKKWEVELGINHDEIEIPWNKPVPEDMFERVGEYCMNDVEATEALFDHTYYDYTARLILSTISGMTVNTKTQRHAARIIFGKDPRPQDKFDDIDLTKEFPGYQFSYGKSTYKGEDPSEGGYVYSEPGIHKNVGLYDVKSMHPNSAINLNYFGPYTKTFKDLVDTRVAIKEGRLDDAREMYEGKLKPFLEDESQASDLAYALKIIINIVYGMTSAPYDNPFKNTKSHDNPVAKRGALFMIDLKNAVQAKGYQVVHIKTDSIKVADADDEIKDFIFEFGKEYGYDFEHEATYANIALVNKAVYIAQYGWAEDSNKIGTWDAVGKQFAEPFVYKTLFSHEDLDWKDYAVVKQTTKPIYIDDLFIGKIAEVYASKTGGEMIRYDEEKDKKSAVTGTKGHKWKLFSEFTDKSDIDMEYYDELIKSAIDNIAKVGDVEKFIEIPEQYAS